MFTGLCTRAWSGRTLLAVLLFDLFLVCAAERVHNVAAPCPEEVPSQLLGSNDCKDKLIASLWHAEFLGAGQRSETWDRLGPQLQDVNSLNPLPSGLAVAACGIRSGFEFRQISRQKLLCVWLI